MADRAHSLFAGSRLDPRLDGPVFVGASRLRLRVVAGERLMATIPATLRQLNFVEAPVAGRRDPAVSHGEREVVLVDGTLDGALDLCGKLPPRVLKILTSTDGSFARRKRCTDAGVDALVADPIEPRELADWLDHFDDRGDGECPKVLVVDDDELAAECVATMLAARGIETEVVADPTRVFDVLERASFDLVLMDLEMPHVNGIDLVRMIRLDRRHLSVPIVFLSAGGDAETQMLARRFGGDDFISKRIDHDLLARLVELRVERARVLRTLIERDGLTGLVDHLRFVERVGFELARSRRSGMPCTLVLIDIDHFKSVNDTWGHQAGDLVLRRLAAALVSRLRRTDVVGRYGGEEFGVLMLDTPADRAAPVVEAFRRHFSDCDMVLPEGTFRIGFSAGVADGRLAADTAAFVAAADGALYRAKSAGRGRVVVAEAPAPSRPVLVETLQPPVRPVVEPRQPVLVVPSRTGSIDGADRC